MNQLFRDYLDGPIPAAPLAELRRSEPRPPTLTELQQGLALQGIIVENWQMDFLDQVLSGALHRPFDRYSIDRSKSHHSSTHVFNWAATKHPSPPGVTDDPSMRLQLDMWTSNQDPPVDPRQQALAAKVARGHGPPSSASWRGKERSTQYRTK